MLSRVVSIRRVSVRFEPFMSNLEQAAQVRSVRLQADRGVRLKPDTTYNRLGFLVGSLLEEDHATLGLSGRLDLILGPCGSHGRA